MKSSSSYARKGGGGFRSVIRLSADWRVCERNNFGSREWLLQSRFSVGSPWATQYRTRRKSRLVSAIAEQVEVTFDSAAEELRRLPEVAG